MNETQPQEALTGQGPKKPTSERKEKLNPNEIIASKINVALINFVRGMYSIRNYISITKRTALLGDIEHRIDYYQKRLHSAENDAAAGVNNADKYVEFAKERLSVLKSRRHSIKEGGPSTSETSDSTYDKHMVKIEDRIFFCDPAILPSQHSAFSSIETRSSQLLYTSSAIQIISTYEMLIARVMHAYYTEYPGVLNKKEVSVTLEEIKSYGTLEEYLQQIIDDEVESFMMQSLDKWTSHFTSMKFDFKSTISNWSEFSEYFYRRNIIVHNEGKVNKRYLNHISSLGSRSEFKEGEQAAVGVKYVDKMLDDMLISGISFAVTAWKKFDKQGEGMVSLLHDLMYSSLMRKQWRVCEKVCDLLDSVSDSIDDRLISKMNRALSIKRQGKTEDLSKMLAKFSHTTHHPRFSAVVYSLLEDIESFFEILPKADFGVADLIEWPILDEMRNDKRFNEYLLSIIDSRAEENIIEALDAETLKEAENEIKCPDSRTELLDSRMQSLREIAVSLGIKVPRNSTKEQIVDLIMQEGKFEARHSS